MSKQNRGVAPITIVIGGAAIALIIGVGIGLRKLSLPKVSLPSSTLITKQTTSAELPVKTSGDREVGNAGELYPYGKMDDNTYREFNLDKYGGSVPIELSGNITMYFVFPMGLSEGLLATFTPYYSMPTASNAVPLSNKLGYGVDFTLEGTRHGDLPHNMYLVFDLDQGKTVKEIRKNPKSQYFCDPGADTFNPSVCAYLNNVPLNTHTSDSYAVVSPTRSEGHTNLLTMRPTIPIGFDNLLVIEIDEEATYIPQELSKELLTDLINANLGSNTNIRTHEAAIQMIKNNLYTPEGIENLEVSLYAITFPEALKTYYELPKFIDYSKDTKKISDTSIEDNKKNLRSYTRQLLFNRNNSNDILTGVAQIKRLEKENILDFSVDKEELLTWMEEEFEYFKEEPETEYLTNILHSIFLLYDQNVSKIPRNFFPQVMALNGCTQGPPDWMKRTGELVDKICSDPNSTGRQMRNALEVAGRTCMDSKLKSCQEKLCAKLDNDLRNNTTQTAIQVAADWTMHQTYCEDGDNDPTYEEYRKKLQDSYDKQVCVTLMEKNLKTFAWNEVKCTRFQDADKKIDGKGFPTNEELKQRMRDAQDRYESEQ